MKYLYRKHALTCVVVISMRLVSGMCLSQSLKELRQYP